MKPLAPFFGLVLALPGLLAALSTSPETPLQAAPPAGRVVEGLVMPSRLLKADLAYSLYLPPDYDRSNRRYPVLYLLHGYTDDDSAWIQWGEAPRCADQAIASGEIPPLIIVMPDAGVSWYIDDASGQVPWESMFFKEFVPHIDATLRTRPKKEFRAVAGLSMGGWGSLGYGMRHPEVFASAAPLSAALYTDERWTTRPAGEYDEVFAHLFGRLEGTARLTPHFRQVNPLELARSLPVETLQQVRWYIDCGDDDPLLPANLELWRILRQRRIPAELRMRDGGHGWEYWRGGLRDALAFIGRGFRSPD